MKLFALLLLACQPLFAQNATSSAEGPRINDKGQQIGYVYPDGAKDSYGYDNSGRMTQFTDRKGATTTFTYRADGSMTVMHPDGSVK